jgi:hypothetical protein
MKNIVRIFLVILISNLVACATPDEETLLRETLSALVTAVEDRSVRQVQKYLTDDFKTARHSNTQQLKTFMLLHFRQNQVINVFTNEVQVNLQQGKADITFNALVTGSSNWLPERGRRFAIQSRWLKRDGDWKISRVNWKEITGFN